MVGTPDNTNRKAIQLTECKRPIATVERLIVDLLAYGRISASMPGVYNRVSIVGIVFVAT